MDSLVIVKRDSRRKPYDSTRIKTAIRSAYLEVENEDKFKEEYIFLEPMINEEISKLNKKEIDVEKIQDIVVIVLKKVNKKVAKAYKDYREKREEERQKKSKKEQFYKEVLQCVNIEKIILYTHYQYK